MHDASPGAAETLPLVVVAHDNGPKPRGRFPRWLLALPLALLLVATGGVVGLYVQPPGLQRVFEATGLRPGGGTDSPIALPPDAEPPETMAATMRPKDVVGLARLLPEGDVSVVAPPYGSGDARVREVLVEEGDEVERGEPVALMDNLGRLEGEAATAEADVAVAEAALARVRRSVSTSLAEARAAVERAEAAAEEAARGLARAETLRARGVASEAALDEARSAARQADRAVAIAQAERSRFESKELGAQPDVLVAQAELGAARARLERARRDLAEARVLAPVAGTVLEVFVRPGERPGSEGILEIGATQRMMAEVEVYQSDVGRVKVGQPVEIAADALGRTLTGTVERVGLTVGRQAVVGDDVAANTDARVVRVLVRLDAASSEAASRLTGLEALARIDAGAEQAALAEATAEAGVGR